MIKVTYREQRVYLGLQLQRLRVHGQHVMEHGSRGRHVPGAAVEGFHLETKSWVSETSQPGPDDTPHPTRLSS